MLVVMRGSALGAMAFAACFVLVPVACGGDSSVNRGSSGGTAGSGEAGSPDPGSGGTAGSASGGKGGSAGKAGAGGVSGTGGGTGGIAMGGAAGSSGEAGSSSDASGGDPGSGGSTAGAANGGMAGAGAMRGYHPPGAQVEGCTSMCQRQTAANCENEETEEQCFDGCRIGIQFEPCASAWDAMFACAETAEVTCAAEGQATAAECITEYAGVVSCVFEDNLDPAYDPRCDDYCGALEGAACTNAEPASECASTCVIIGSAFPVCDALYTNFLACGTDSDITCDDQGSPTASACAADYVLFLNCLVTEYDYPL
jgi:hypothetical protein